MAVIEKAGMAATNFPKRGAVKNIMPLIVYMHAWAQRANAGNTSHTQAPAHLNRQTVGIKPKANQPAQAPITQGQVIKGLRDRPNAHKPPVVCAHFAPLEGADLGEACSPCQTS